MKFRFLLSIFLIILFSGASLSLMADGNDRDETKKAKRALKDRYLGLGLGFSSVKVMDQATSPLLYKGFNFPFVSPGFMMHSEKAIRTFEADFSYGNLKSRTETPWYDSPNTSYLLVLRFNMLYRIHRIVHQKVNWYIGPEFNTNAHFRVNYKYENSALTFDSYSGVGIATRFEYPFGYKSGKYKFLWMNLKRRDRDMRLSWQLSAPVLSFLIRPTYVTVTNFIDPDLQARITSENTGGGFFEPFNLRSQTELHYILHNQNMFKLSYIWNFYSHDPGYNKAQSAFHGLQFSFVFKFNDKPVTK